MNPRPLAALSRPSLVFAAAAILAVPSLRAATLSRPAGPAGNFASPLSIPALALSAVETSPLAPPSLGLPLSSGFLMSLRAGEPVLPRFDAELPTPMPVAAPLFTRALAAEAAPTPAQAPLALYQGILSGSPSNLTGLSPAQMADLWDRTYRHRISGLDDASKLSKYDPQGIIGFCFGRAMTVHLLARRMGLAPDSIRNLFVIGDLRSGDQPEWRFHVTSLVKGADGRWHAIDPIMDGPLTVDQWMSRVHRGWDRQKKAKFYLTGADAVLPDITEVPDLPKERAAKIIELSFDPAGKPGFSRWPGASEAVYEVDAERQEHHLRVAGSKAGAFDFSEVTVNGMTIGYNGYFADLLAEIARPSKSQPRSDSPYALVPPPLPGLGLNMGRLGFPPR